MYIENNEKYSLLRHRLASGLCTKAVFIALSAMAVITPAAAQTSDSDNKDLEEVIVTGLRGSVQSAQKIKFNAEQIVDSIVADDIANLPDRSVTETLQRIPGVTIDRFISSDDPEHFGGEGSGVAIRGLTQVRGEINGRDGFSANGGRSLSFEDVPPELLAGVDVYKNPSADMIEGGLGGTVNLRTRMPLDIDEQLIGFTLSASYQDLIEETTPAASALYSNRWDTGIGEIGFLIDLAYSELDGRIDVVQVNPYFPYDTDGDTVFESYIPRGAGWRIERTYRERQGIYSAFQWRPNDDLEYYATIFRSEYDFSWDEDALFVDNDPYTVETAVGVPGFDDPVYDANNVFVSGTLIDTTNGGINMGADTRFANRNSTTTDFATGLKWQASSNWLLSTDIQSVKATTDGFDSTVTNGLLMPYITVDVSGGGAPSIMTDTAYMVDPANYYFAFTMDHHDDNAANQIAWRGDAEYTFDNVPGLRSLKFGLRYADRDSTTINTIWNWQPVIQPWMRWWALPGDQPLPSIVDFGMEDQVHVNTFSNFYRGDIPVPGSVIAPNRALAEGYPDTYYQIHDAALPYYDCCYYIDPDPDNPVVENRVGTFSVTQVMPQNENKQQETVNSAYLLLRFGWDNIGLDGNVGVRLVETQNIASGFVNFPDPTGFPIDDDADLNTPYDDRLRALFDVPDMVIAVDNTYTNTLPSLNLRWQFLDQFVARFAYSKAIARPNFNDMQSYLQLFVNRNDGTDPATTDPNDFNGSATGGNPNLKPIEADQLDLAFEWYYSDIGSAWLNLFSKDLDGFIRTATFIETYNGFDYVIQRPENQDKATIDGWELGWRQFWDSGFGFEASYTHIDSTTEGSQFTVPTDTNGTEFDLDALPYEGLSENSYSTIFMFENQLISTRLAYTWRDEFLVGVGATGFNGNNNNIAWRLPVFQEPYGQWDGSIFFNITDQYSIGLESNNLTNEEIELTGKQTNGSREAKTYSVQDTRWALTLRGSF